MVPTVVSNVEALVAPSGKIQGSDTILGEVTCIDYRFYEERNAKKGSATSVTASCESLRECLRVHRPMFFTVNGNLCMGQKSSPDAKSDMEVLVAEVNKLNYWVLPMQTSAMNFGAVVRRRDMIILNRDASET